MTWSFQLTTGTCLGVLVAGGAGVITAQLSRRTIPTAAFLATSICIFR